MEVSSHRLETELLDAIKLTAPMLTAATTAWEVHILTGEKQAVMCMWALKTLAVAVGGLPCVVIHDDGSLRPETIHMLQKHFPSSHVITEQELKEKSDFWTWLMQFDNLHYWRREVDLCLARRLIDFRYFAQKKYLLVLDTDVLFFRRPEQIMSCIAQEVPFAMSDYMPAYYPAIEDLATLLHNPIPACINGGLWGLPIDVLDPSKLNMLLGRLAGMNRQFEWGNFWLDQTLLALVMAESPRIMKLSEATYSIAFRRLSEETIAHHFPNSTARKLYCRVGLRKLYRQGIIEEITLLAARTSGQ